MDAVPLHLFSLLGLNIKMEAPKEADDDHDPEDEAHAESKGWVCLTHCISTTATAEPETIAVQLTAGRGKYSCHVWPKFHERQAEGIFLAPNMSPSKDEKWPFSSQLEYRATDLRAFCSHTFKWILFDSILLTCHFTDSNTTSYKENVLLYPLSGGVD